MTTETTTPPLAARHDRTEELADAAAGLGIIARAGELALAVLAVLLFCPPLMILAVAVIVPTLVLAILAGLIAALVAAPVLVVRHVRAHHRAHRSSALAHGLRSLRARHA